MNNHHKIKTPGRPPIKASGEPNVRERFLDAAIALFASQGVVATSMAQIAGKVQVSPAMAHYYFSNREKLLDAVVDERIKPFIDSVWSDFSANKKENIAFLDSIQALIYRLTHASMQLPWLPALWVGEILSPSGQFRERIMQYINSSYFGNFEQAFEQAKQCGEINSNLDSRLFIISILGSTLLPLALHTLVPVNLTTQQGRKMLSNHACELLLSGAKALKGQPARAV